MSSFLRRFAAVVAGVLSGFDRVVFKGRMPQLYSPEGMNCYAAANHVRLLDFQKHAKEVTQQVLQASLLEQAKAAGRFQYVNSGKTSKDEAARGVLERHRTDEGLVALLQCVEPCWTFDTKSIDRRLTIVGEMGKCSSLYHYSSLDVLRFLGRSRLPADSPADIHSDVKPFEESVRLKHWVDGNSLKMYDHCNILRAETTINNPKEFRSYRAAVGDPDGPKDWRVLQRGVADTHRRAEVSQKANERYLDALSSVAAVTTLEKLVAPWCRRVREPGPGDRWLRALNPFAADDLALLTAVSDPKWLVNGLRNRDLAEAQYGPTPDNPAERKRRSARVSRLLRLLRAHGIIKKVPKCHRYQVCDKARDSLLALLAARNANPQEFTAKAA